MFEGWALRQAIKSALRKPAPERYSYSAQNRKKIDYRTVVLKFADQNDLEIMVQGMNSSGIVGLGWNGDGFENEICVSLRHINDASFTLHRVLGSSSYNFKTPSSYLMVEWSKKLYFQELRDRFNQRVIISD